MVTFNINLPQIRINNSCLIVGQHLVVTQSIRPGASVVQVCCLECCREPHRSLVHNDRDMEFAVREGTNSKMGQINLVARGKAKSAKGYLVGD